MEDNVAAAAKPHELPAWPEFEDWARREGIGFDHEDDWISFWETFNAGYNIGYKRGELNADN